MKRTNSKDDIVIMKKVSKPKDEQAAVIEFEVPAADFVMKHIFECGQCFRWEKESIGNKESYIGIAGGRVARVSIPGSGVLRIEQFSGSNDGARLFWNNYFDLSTDYGIIKEQLASDAVLKKAIPFGHGIRILKQDPWETTVSFIISQNNNIPRIKKNIRDLSALAGEQVFVSKANEGIETQSIKGIRDHQSDTENKEPIKWFEIPPPEVLARLTVDDLAPVRLGYRARYLIETAQCVCDRGLDVLYEDLDSLCGVGPKVASCIRLFGLNQISSFPIDVWVKRVMSELYGIDRPSEMKAFAEKTFGKYGGIAQQYLFYYMREK